MGLARMSRRAFTLTLLAVAAICQSGAIVAQNATQPAPLSRAALGKKIFEEKCRTEAGEKIYRSVQDVDGLLLMKLRVRNEAGWSDPMWPGAAFAREWNGDDYIRSFLGYEFAPGDGLTGKAGQITKERRGYISVDRRAGGVPGFQFVDVVDEKSGETSRYTLISKVRSESKIGRVDTLLNKQVAPVQLPKYGVTFEDHVVPEDRAMGIASSTIRVVDLTSQEILGELLRFAWTPGPSLSNEYPWLTALRCPDHAVGTGTATRKFVDQVLIPRKLD